MLYAEYCTALYTFNIMILSAQGQRKLLTFVPRVVTHYPIKPMLNTCSYLTLITLNIEKVIIPFDFQDERSRSSSLSLSYILSTQF